MSTGGSTTESRSGDISTDPASPNGPSTPERPQHPQTNPAGPRRQLPQKTRRLDQSPDRRRGGAERLPWKQRVRPLLAHPWRCLDCAAASLDMTRRRKGEARPIEQSTFLRTPRHVDRRLDSGEPKWRHLHGSSIPERIQHPRTIPAGPGRCLDGATAPQEYSFPSVTAFCSTRPVAGGESTSQEQGTPRNSRHIDRSPDPPDDPPSRITRHASRP